MEFVVHGRVGAFDPNADVVVDDDGRRVVVVVELAGVDPDALRVGMDERHLYLTGRRREPLALRRGSLAQKEIGYGEFVKRIALPLPVEYNDATATYDDGLLVIALPVSAPAYRPTARTELHILVKRITS